MAAEMLNIQDYSGYIKCGEILKSPLPTYQYPYILKCYQCDTINFVLESFIIHIQEHCNYDKTLAESIDIKIPPEDSEEIENNEPIENPIVKIETITMDVDDPLIVIKDEVVEEHTPPEEVETYDYSKEQNENVGDYSSNSDDNYQSGDYDSDEECALIKEQITMINPSNFCDTNIEEKQNTNSINSADLNSIRKEFKKDLNKTELVLTNEIKRQTDIIKRYLDRFLEHTKVITNQNPTITKTANIIPKQPFSTIEDFLDFENEIKNDEEKYNQLISEFEQQSASSIQNFVKSIWRKLIVDAAAQHMCWKGTDKKTPVRSLTITQALKAVCAQKFTLETDLNFEKISIHHFQQAKGRHQKKLNYISRNKETNKKTKKKKKNALPPTVGKFIKSKNNMKILIELYKNQPNLWNKDLPFYRFRDKRQGFLEETTKDLNSKLDSQYTWKEVSDIISYIYRKHRDDFKRLRLYEEEDKNPSKDTKYKRCWFFDDLYFLRPKPVIQLQKLDNNLPDLTSEQIIQIIQIYREFPHLWNSNLIEFICSNKRHEAHVEMLKSLETNMNINISETALEEYLRTLHYYFSKEKRLRLKSGESNSKNLAEDFYEHLMYLYDHEGPFSCTECNRSFSKPLGFKVHKSNHDDSIPFICSQCNKEFKTLQSYTVHAKRHFEDLDFVCNVCSRKFVTYADLRVHLLTHSGDRPYCCEICGTSYRHIQCFKRHQRRHEKRYTHTCHICSKGYYSKDRYDDHMNSHMNIRQHICQLCGKGFITSRALKTHAVTHEDARNHACKLCGKTFKLKIGVLQHMRTHGSRVESEDKN